jgi:hypothetical protein
MTASEQFKELLADATPEDLNEINLALSEAYPAQQEDF